MNAQVFTTCSAEFCEPIYWMSHPLQQTHLLEVGAGVGQPLQCVCQVVVSAEVEAVCSQHIVNHGQESLILLRLKEERKQTFSFQENLRGQRTAHSYVVLVLCMLGMHRSNFSSLDNSTLSIC